MSEKIIHPKSRKAAQMIRNAHRKDKVDRYVLATLVLSTSRVYNVCPKL